MILFVRIMDTSCECTAKVCIMKKKRPRRDSNPQSSDPKSDALSIRPRGHIYNRSFKSLFNDSTNR